MEISLMPEVLPPTPPGSKAVTTSPPAPEDDRFALLVRSSARDPLVRCYFANLLEAQPMPAEQKDAIWRSFEATAAKATHS
jgi:hypothetical protein